MGAEYAVIRFEGHRAAFATCHMALLGVMLTHVATLDTDAFGTFTRTVPGRGSALDAARLKLVEAQEVRGDDLELTARVGLPEHALVVSGTPEVRTFDELGFFVAAGLRGSPVRLEPDMRAHLGLTRQRASIRAGRAMVLAAVARRLRCDTPAFVEQPGALGSPGEACAALSSISRTTVSRCQACSLQGEVTATPSLAPAAQCPKCNP